MSDYLHTHLKHVHGGGQGGDALLEAGVGERAGEERDRGGGDGDVDVA